MTAKRNLSYESVKAILEKMPAETRIDLAQLSKKENTAEKCTPLELDSLTLRAMSFTVNDRKTYSFLLFSKHTNEKGELEVQSVPFDLLSNGACAMKLPEDQPSDEFRLDSRPMCRNDERARAMKERYKAFLLKTAELNDEKETSRGMFYRFKELEETLYPQLCPIGQISEFQHIRFITSDGIRIKEETIPYKRSVHDAMRHLVFKSFGGRRHVSVDTLKIHLYGFHRYPVDLKFRVKHLKIVKTNEADVNSVIPLIDPSSFPLESISTDCCEKMNNEIFKHCKELRLGPIFDRANYSQLAHKNVVFFELFSFETLFEEQGVRKSLMNAEVGTRYFLIACLNEAKNAVGFMTSNLNAKHIRTEKEDLSLQPAATLPIAFLINDSKEVQVFFKSDTDEPGICLLVQSRRNL